MIEKSSKLGKERIEQRDKKEELEKQVRVFKERTDMSKQYQLSLHVKNGREYQAVQDSLLHIGLLKNRLHELDQEAGLTIHQTHSMKAGSDCLTAQERDMHAELVRLNKIAVEANNHNYNLMKRKDIRDMAVHEDIKRTERVIAGQADAQERILRH